MICAAAPQGLPLWLARRWVVCWLVGTGASSIAQAPVPATEAAVKAAYLHKFLFYIEWPAKALPAPDTPLVMAVAGADAVLSELQALPAGRQVRGRSVTTRRLDEDDALDGLHVVFVGRAAYTPRLIQRLKGRPVLVITETRLGLESGAMLNFVAVDGRVRFEAAPATAERAGIKLGSRLLAVAERVAR